MQSGYERGHSARKKSWHAVARHEQAGWPVDTVIITITYLVCWWRGSVVERRALAGELSLSCARPAADG